MYGLLSLVRNSGAIAVDYSRTSTEVFFETIQGLVRDEMFMRFDIESHVNIATDLRDNMGLHIDTSVMRSYIKSQYEMMRTVKGIGDIGERPKAMHI